MFTGTTTPANGGKAKPDGGKGKCTEGQIYEGKGEKWICKNGKWVKLTADAGGTVKGLGAGSKG